MVKDGYVKVFRLTFNIVIAALPEQLHYHSLHTLGLVHDGFCANLEVANISVAEIVSFY